MGIATPAAVPSAPPLPEGGGVESEVGRLRTVLVHRPADEVLAVDAANAARLLYAGPMDLGRAQAEHDAFAAVLRSRGVEVLYVEQLLAEVIERNGSPSPAALARALIEGIPEQRLDPLPNLLFTRDSSAWIGRRVLVGAMSARVRSRESRLIDAVYGRHPRFLGASGRIDSPATPLRVEGGDVLVAGPGRVIVGISPRTSAEAAHRFASALLTTGCAKDVLTVRLPREAGFHLDLVLSIVDRETVAVWEPARALLRAHAWRATSRGVAVHAIDDPFAWLSPSARVIGIEAPHARAWDHGVNVLAIAPGVVIAYADNHDANAQLRAAGIEVIPVSGTALGRGRGGPRCLTCPIARAAA